MEGNTKEPEGNPMATLYAMIVEFGGGTYVSQASAASPRDALLLWSDEANARGDGLAPRLHIQIKKQLEARDQPVPLEGCSNVWCFSGQHESKLVLVHIISTWAP